MFHHFVMGVRYILLSSCVIGFLALVIGWMVELGFVEFIVYASGAGLALFFLWFFGMLLHVAIFGD